MLRIRDEGFGTPIHFDMDGNPMEFMAWAKAMNGPRHIGSTCVTNWLGFGYWVSTVWLGLDLRFSGDGPPLIFETMIFRWRPRWARFGWVRWLHGKLYMRRMGANVFTDRYSTKTEAAAGHAAAVEMAEKGDFSNGD